MEQAKAHAAVAKAVADGRLWRPSKCSKCRKKGKIHGHHRDYTKPLDVVWLCPRCHGAEHKGTRKPREPLQIEAPRPVNHLTTVRERFGLNIAEMADLIGVLPQDWSAWETGIVSPRREHYQQIMLADWLILGKGDPP